MPRRDGLRLWPPPAEEFSSGIALPLLDYLRRFIIPTVPVVNERGLVLASALVLVLGLTKPAPAAPEMTPAARSDSTEGTLTCGREGLLKLW